MTPKDFWGMGFGSLRVVNLAMLSKWWWRFKVERDSLWRKVVWEIHNSARTWSFIPAKLSVASPWKQIYNIKGDFSVVGLCLEAMFRGHPGSNSEIYFWKERWLMDVPLCDRFPTLFQLESHKKAFIKERVIVGSEGLEPAFMWSRLPSNAVELAEMHSLMEALKNFILGKVQTFGAGLWIAPVVFPFVA
ncbi:uncharacterized protein LOC110913415 [Helianthus annuus]|uniref:uncharacterized protein LOC110913415 n=1 Tax=Helianthus annuus TaxID=4232 RepID=UPI000B8F2702|nr:uncharacterized protein LOC110913415 [Helianthus annuus]